MLCLCTGTGIILMFNVTNLEVFVGVKTFVSKGTGLFPPSTIISCCHSYGTNISESVSLTQYTLSDELKENDVYKITRCHCKCFIDIIF